MFNRISRMLSGAILAFMAWSSVASAQTDFTFVEAASPEEILLAETIQNTYVEGIAATNAGQLGLAARAFQAILLVQPGHIRARRALVDVLMTAGEYEAAESHIKLLLKTDPNSEAISRYYGVQDEIIRRTPLSYSGEFAVLPSSNINNGTRVRFLGPFENIDGYETSGYGIRLGGNGSYRWSLGQGQQVQLLGSVTANLYEIEALQNAVATVSLEYQRDTEATYFSIGPYLRRTWYLPVENPANSPDNYAVGLALGYTWQISPEDKLAFSLNYEDQTHFATSLAGNYKSGPYAATSLRYDHKISDALGVFATIGAQEYAPPLSGHLAYVGGNVSIGANKLWSPTLLTGITLSGGQRQYQEDFTAYPFPRHDEFYSIELSVKNAKLKVFGIIPQLSCTYLRNNSNIEFFYQYETTTCQVALTRDF